MSTKWIMGSFITCLVISFQACSPETDTKTSEGIPANKLFSTIPGDYSGLTFNNKLTEDPKNILNYDYYFNGGGVSIGDINNDGLQDIFLTGNEVSNRLYLNKGDLQFEDITEKAGLISNTWSTGASMADINGDGLLDIYVCNSGPDKNGKNNLFYLNKGNLKFEELAAEYGIQDEGRQSTQSAFFDYDLDGDLDLFVMNHSILFDVPFNELTKKLRKPGELRKSSNSLYRNENNGTFTDVTNNAGLLNYGYGLGLVISDINSDGYADIYISNDFDIPDFMYINQKNGTFKDQIKWKTKHVSWNGMGCDIADINNDGNLDIAVVDMTPDDHVRSKILMKSMDTDYAKFMIEKLRRQHQYMFNSLQIGNGAGIFSDIAQMAGVAKTDWSWSALLSDLDNDGYKDYFVTNGYRKYSTDNDFKQYKNKFKEGELQMSAEEFNALYSEVPELKLPNALFHNKGDLTFENIALESGLEQATFSNGSSIADLDNDGDLDIVINNIDDEMLLYRNNSTDLNQNHFLQIGFEKTAFQAKVKLYYDSGKIQVQENSPVRGYQSSLPEVLHFGLGDTKKVDSIDILWPDGTEQHLYAIEANQVLKIKKEPSKQRAKLRPSYLLPIVNPAGLGLDYKHEENNHDDLAKEVLLPHAQSKLGPFTTVGDLNGDGLEDIFIGGAKAQSGSIFLQSKQGKFEKLNSPALDADRGSEDMDALFFDFDQDGDQDLYVVSGGGSDFENDSPLLQDRLYINTGKGRLKKSHALPIMLTSSAKVKTFDFDKDGDLDLFVGGRTIPGKYPHAPRSYLLENRKGKFIDVTDKRAPGLATIGMVTDFVWSDINGDKIKDLVVVGEWMPVSFFTNNGKGFFTNQNDVYGSENLKGWWYSISAFDFNGDSKDDYVLGNIGLNNKFHPSHEKPLKVYSNDYDNNGKLDIVLNSYYKGKEVPMRGKECSTEQIPDLESKFPSYRDFANASLQEVYGSDKLSESLQLEANTFTSTVLVSSGDNFKSIPLANEAQVSPINKSLIRDVNKDGHADLILAGNMFQTEFETTRYDASNGLVLSGNGDGTFQSIPFESSGFSAPLDVKDMEWFQLGNRKQHYLIISSNNMPVQIYRTR